MSDTKNEQVLIEAFFRILWSVSPGISVLKDDYFAKLLADEFFLFFSELAKCFQKFDSESLHILRMRSDVVLKLVEVVHHLKKLDEISYLNIQRSTLVFHKSLLNFQLTRTSSRRETKNNPISTKNFVFEQQTLKQDYQLKPIKRQLLQIIRSQKQVLNSDLFSQLPNLTRRSVKRHLSELVSGGYISRYSEGKRVIYIAKDSGVASG